MPRADSRMRLLILLTVLLPIFSAGAARAAGPRWVTGPPFFTAPAGTAVTWFTWLPQYFTDLGDLSTSVNHAAADAIVAAAFNVWNVPTAGINIAHGGILAEDVSGANSYLSSTGPVFPADVESSNYTAVQIAVVYDSDGSVTDMLLGSGASVPSECQSNAVTEDVDLITPDSYIRHAILVLNGRCTGTDPDAQLQMQYQLERAVGRVLGLGWSQTNDNVFTGTPEPSLDQAMHWPIMHPIDIACGTYTYQCLPQPFTLRDDDVAAISQMYPMITYGNSWPAPPAPGKTWTYIAADYMDGTVSFPSGEGMQGVNVVVHRQPQFSAVTEQWEDTSSVSGYRFRSNVSNPVSGAVPGMAGSMGNTDPSVQGYYYLGWIPMTNTTPAAETGIVSTQATNPLYTGSHAVGPYTTGSVSPSGSSMSGEGTFWLVPLLHGWEEEVQNFAPPDAAKACNSGTGSESAPAVADLSGWWTGGLCVHGDTTWTSFATQAGRTATVEITALDESGLATLVKAMPVIGVWGTADATGILPTVASAGSAFNSTSLGVTSVAFNTQAGGMRLAIADQRGDGRPDFAYRARVLYADSIEPAATSFSGGELIVHGMGFRQGNAVLVNGVSAQVASWTPTEIIAVAPPVSAFTTNLSGAVDVVVKDLSTGGTTSISAALRYDASIPPDQMDLVSSPAGIVAVGSAAVVPFAVRMTLGDGITAVAGLPVTISSTGAQVSLSGCVSLPCTVLTDASGMAAAQVTPLAFGAVVLQAASVGVSQTARFSAVAESITPLEPAFYVASGVTFSWTPQVSVSENSSAASGWEIGWTASGGLSLSAGSSMVNAQGIAGVPLAVGPLAAHALASAQACTGAGSPLGILCAHFSVTGVGPEEWQVEPVSGVSQTIALNGTFAPVVVRVTDGAGHPVAGAAVSVRQSASAWTMACPARGACPSAAVLGGNSTAAVSDVNGLVSINPMQLAGSAEVTNIAVVAGTAGFCSLAVQQGP